MNNNLSYKKELSLLLGILVAAIILFLFFLPEGIVASNEVSHSQNLLFEAPITLKLLIEKTSLLLNNIVRIW
jgi:hypothetical protein